MAATHPNSGVAVDPEPLDARLLERAKLITERELDQYKERTTGSQRATERARRVLPLGVPSSFQAYDPHPIVVRPRVRVEDDRRRRQRVHRLRHGLRRPLRRAHEPGRARRGRGPAGRRLALRHPVRAQRRGRRAVARPLRPADVALHQLGHGGDDGCHPPRPGRDRPQPHRQGRGRLSRASRRGDDLDEAAARAGRPSRCPELRAGYRGDHPRRRRRHGRRAVQRSRRPRAGPPLGRHRLLHPRTGDGEHRHLPARRGLPAGGSRAHDRARHRAHLRRGQDRDHRRLSEGPPATSGSSPTSSPSPSRSAAASRSGRSVASRRSWI